MRPRLAPLSDTKVSDPSGVQALSLAPRFRAWVALGGNVGEVQARLRSAVTSLGELPGTCVERVSSLYRTRPVDAGGPDFLNAVVALDTALAPEELMRALLRTELAHDRERPHVNAPRTLDLDLLHHGGATRSTSTLTLPHPRQHSRAFVMVPLAELVAALPPRADSPTPDVLSPEKRAQLGDEQGIERICGPNWLD